VRVKTAAAFVLAGLAPSWSSFAQGTGPDSPTRSPGAVLVAMAEAWQARDADAYLRFWRFGDEEARTQERAFLAERWSGEEAVLAVETPLAVAGNPRRATASAQVFTVTEPRGRVAQMIYTFDRGPDGWAVIRREEVGDIAGLVHLSLDPQGFQAAGMTVRLEDFEMTWTRGSLFTSPVGVGPTVLVFVGEGTVRFRPRVETERNQLRHYGGSPELVETVRSAFIRIHSADFHRVLSPSRLEPDPEAPPRYAAALRMYRDQVEQAFVLDTTLPRSPWWLTPALGDALVSFQGRRGVLTYVLSHSDAEGITLFDRRRRLQITLYPVEGRDTEYNEDDGMEADVLHHDLSVRFQPERSFLSGEDTIRIRLRTAAPTVKLRLDDSLRVESIRSSQGGQHLFFRVRHQDSLMVSLGPLSGRAGEIVLTVRFSGVHHPEPIEREVLQVVEPPFPVEGDVEIPLEPVLVYSNRTAWYPQGAAGDYATAVLKLDVPAGNMAVTGGASAAPRTESGHTLFEYRQELPGKYITVAVGRLVEAGGPAAPPNLRGFSVPRVRSQTPAILAEAAAMITFFEGIFGPSPYPTLNAVLLEGRTPGGHSPPGMIVMSLRPPLLRSTLRDDPATFWDVPGFFLAHELAHQWWGQGVAGQNYHERWLSEAMAQYAAALWTRHRLGDAMFQTVMERMARWAMRHSNLGPIHLGHRLGHLQSDPQIFRAVVYDKGAWVLHMLRQLVGDDAFARALTALQRDHRFAKVGSEHLRAALEKESGLALEPYFREWVHGTALPELRVSRRTTPGAGSFATAVTIAAHNLPGPVPLEIAVIHSGGREGKRVELPPEGGTFTIETKTRPRRVEVNAEGGILARVVDSR
jgi:peptidase M1-like protein